MVERQFAERCADLRTAGEHGHFALVKRRTEHARQQFRATRRELAGLDHGAIAGRENSSQWREGEIEWKIPRTDDADDALRLILDIGACAEKAEYCGRHFALLAFHPGLEVRLGVFQRANGAGDIGEQRSMNGAVHASLLTDVSG